MKARKNAVCCASGLPTLHRLNLTNSEQNRDWLRASRCLSRFCSQPHQQRTKLGLAPSFEVPVPLLFPTSPTANKTGTGSELRGACPDFVPSSNEPTRTSPLLLKAAGAIRFQFIPNCQRSSERRTKPESSCALTQHATYY